MDKITILCHLSLFLFLCFNYCQFIHEIFLNHAEFFFKLELFLLYNAHKRYRKPYQLDRMIVASVPKACL
jgi:hypothetical protein